MTKYKGPIEEVKLVEKVTLTKEQSTTLKKMRNCHHLRNDKDAMLVKHAAGWTQGYNVLNEIPMLVFAQLVLNDFSYEVEPEKPKFKTADKVVPTYDDRHSRILTLAAKKDVTGYEIDKFGPGWRFDEISFWLGEKQFRHATPEEIYWLETLGREKVGDCRDGDILVDDRGIQFTVGNEVDKESAGYWMKDENIVGIYPAESFKPYPGEFK